MSFALRQFISGKSYSIYGLEKDGRCPVSEFFSEMELNDEDALASMFALLKRMAEHGPGHNIEKFRSVRNGIYEFKAKQLRACWFYDEGRMVICANGFAKGAKKAQNRAINEAIKDKDAYFAAKKQENIPIKSADKP